jgi:predicted nuclease of predicted toxin-antitoxin system
MFAGLKEHFEALGYSVITAQEVGLKSVKDREIVEYAKKHDLLLVTQDAKPAEIAELTCVKCVLVTNAMLAKVVDAKIRQCFL